jgi:hypothetical protein
MAAGTTRIDLGREYLAGLATPNAEQAGYRPRVDGDGTNFVYQRLAQVLNVSGTWDQESEAVHVKGSGARAIALPDPTADVEGFEVLVLDALGNAGAGNITIDPSGSGTINGSGTLVLSTNYASARLRWISAGVWVRV